MQPLLLGRGSLDPRTWDAVMRKVDNSRSRLPGWIARQPADRDSPFSDVGQSSLAVALLDAAAPVVIRIAKVDARSYGLFLSYLLGFLEESRRQAAIGPQLVVIDEAADIFRAESAHLRSAATDMLGRHIAKGRSQKLAYLIATQSAADIPEGIRLNLNTMIAGRHRHPRVLKEALPDAGFDVAPIAARLRPGEMLVELFKLPLLRVGMYRSPMRLS
jgi:DNA helicase HerA-like ATPase